MKKSLIGSMTLLLLTMLLGCTASQQVESRFRERVLPNTIGSSSALDKFGIRYFDEGAIVLFTGDDPQQARCVMMGYAVFHLDLGLWNEGLVGSSSRQATQLTLETWVPEYEAGPHSTPGPEC